MLKTSWILGGLLIAVSARAEQYVIHSENSLAALNIGAPVLQAYPLSGSQVVDLSQAQAQALRDRGVEIEPNQTLHLFGKSAAKSSQGMDSPTWFLKALNLPQANALDQGTGEGINVCVVDSGIDTSTPDLANVLSGGVNLVADENPNDLSDRLNHGTAISSLIAGRGLASVRGAAPAATIYMVKVFGAEGGATIANVSEGILSCIGKSQVINLSLGSFDDSPAIRSAIDKALARGLVVIAAAGNEPNDIAFPARYAPVIAVGAVNASLQVSTFSGRGPALDFVAPGENIAVLSPGGAVVQVSGTSFSAALATGVEAIRLGRMKYGTQSDLQARDLGLPAYAQGKGLIDALLSAQ